MSGRGQSLAQYANRRYYLAGGALLTDFNPYFMAVDQFEQECAQNGLHFLNFGQYDYLALGDDQRVRTAAAEAILEGGLGAGASRLVGGERLVHRELEAGLARFVGTEDALALVSGYGANLALVGHLLTTGDLIIADEYAHNSIMLGTKLSRAETMIFEHNDLDALSALLDAKRDKYRRVLVIVEGLYSMEGDIPDLPRLLELCERNNAWLMVDEAHSIGVLGRSGRGICEHFDIDPGRIDLIVGTLSKAFANCGGFICAKAQIIEWLRYTLPGFVYSVGLAPHVATAVRTSLEVIESEPHRVAQLQKMSRYFVAQGHRQGFDVGSAIGAGVVPIKFDDAHTTLSASKALLDAGIYVPPVVQIGVPKGMPRLRFFISSVHTTADIDRVFSVLSSWRDQLPSVPKGKLDMPAPGSHAIAEAMMLQAVCSDDA